MGFQQAALSSLGRYWWWRSARSSVVRPWPLCSALFLIVLPIAGFPLGGVDWVALVAMLALCSVAMTAAGVALAWWVDSSAGYHALLPILLMPAWFASGDVLGAARRLDGDPVAF